MHNAQWNLIYNQYKPEQEGHREALCTLGNGYFATRGAMEMHADDKYHYPGTYLSGGYNRLQSEISNKIIENEDLVNWPNWLPLKFKPEGGEWISMEEMQINHYKHDLNIRHGVLKREIHFTDGQQREWMLKTQRLVHIRFSHLACIRWELTCKNWSGNIIVHAALDAGVTNNGVARYSDLSSKHLTNIHLHRFKEDGISVTAQTTQSNITMAQSAKVNVKVEHEMLPIERTTIKQEKYIAQEIKLPAEKNKKITIDKTVALYTSRDHAIADPLSESQNAVLRALDYPELYNSHASEWERLWDGVDTRIGGNGHNEQMILRLHVFHLLQTTSMNNIDTDIGIPSRGWHGEAYRGHILWDEIFVFPLLTMRLPELARNLLMYRYRRLPEARYNAQNSKFKGAMFPWQSGSNGREESQVIHLNPYSGNWVPDNTFLQRHVNAAIVYNVWKYFEITNDLEFMSMFGAEIILDVAQFWADKAEWNKQKNKYEIKQVVGPDEYHTKYPDSDAPGINNNAYTNVMAVWVLKQAIKTVGILDPKRRVELTHQLNIQKEDIERWGKISQNMFVPFIKNNRVFSQFEGFEKLKDLDWDKYHKKYGEILRLDRILEKEGDDVNAYKAVKQADVLMLFYLLSVEELSELLQGCGYNFKPEYIRDNIYYYNSITSHGSTLSKLVHSWIMARSYRDKSWHNFQKALVSDLSDIQGGTTAEGIHLGAMAGTVDLIQRCYTGLEVRDGILRFNPQLPENLSSIAFRLKFRGRWISLDLTAESIKLACDGGWNKKAIKVCVDDKIHDLVPGQELVLEYKNEEVISGRV